MDSKEHTLSLMVGTYYRGEGEKIEVKISY
jgi:hypothetical protein